MDIFGDVPPPADHRIRYGSDPLQFGDLRLPAVLQGTKAPVVVFLHGGWWQSAYDLVYGGFVCEALRKLGIATWSLEYRRVGNPGGGWPGTMQDAAAGFDHLASLAQSYPLDLKGVVTMGHSAGGHLALWLAGRHHIPPGSPLHDPQPGLTLSGVIGLAAAADLRLTIDLGGYLSFTSGKPAVRSLMGGLPTDGAEMDARYRAANPGDLLPLNVAQVLLQGSEDNQIPAKLPERYAQNARRQGDRVTVSILAGADHFQLVDPTSKAWPAVQAAVLTMLGMKG